MRIKLADQEEPVTTAANRLADHFLGATLTIHFGGIEQRNAHVERGANHVRLVLKLIRMLALAPGAEPECRHAVSRRQVYIFHHC